MKRRTILRASLSTAVIPMAGLLASHSARSQTSTQVLRFVPQANLTILDPIWTTAYVTRNHGYMVYDTLFSMDSKGRVQPQMLEKWTTSKDGKTWGFVLRPGLEFHDGAPVTSEDVIASLKRWASRDTMGAVLATFIAKYEAVDARSFNLVLNEPCGIMLDALGKPSSNVPFIMPARIAATPGTEQIKEPIGSGPFIFKADEFKPGDKAVYVKNTKYKPRAETSDGLAGGKVVNFERVEWIIIRDAQTQFNALLNGEVDWIEQPSFEQIASLKVNPDIRLEDLGPAGSQFVLRFNFLYPPFDNVQVRRAALVALGQEAMLKTQIAVPGLYRVCRSIYPCGTPYASEDTGYFTGVANPAKAAQMLKEAGYNGTPVVLMRPTDIAQVNKIPLVAKQQLEAAGFKVDMQQMDWASLVARRAKKTPPDQGGWNIFMSGFVAADIANPLTAGWLNATGDKGWFGWHNEPRMGELKAQFARARSDAEKKKLALELQKLSFDTAAYAPLGQFIQPSAVRKNLKGLLPAEGIPLMWNVTKG